MRLLGAILAGGQSQRFGSDKALAELDGKPMIARVAEALAPSVAHIVVCGHPMPPAGMIGVADLPHAGLGPLGGLAGALHHAHAHGYEAVISVGCDTPILDPDLMTRLCAVKGAGFVTDSPIIGRWPATLADVLLLHLDRNTRRSMRGWAEAVEAHPIDAPHPVPNINTRLDLEDLFPSQRHR